MELATATVTVPGSLDGKLQAIAEAGFSSVEIFASELEASGADAATIHRRVDDLGMSVCTFMPFREFEALPEPRRSENFDRAEQYFDIMQALETDLLLVCTNVSPDTLPDRGRMIDDFRQLGERAGRRGLRIGIEPLAWGTHVSDYRDGWKLVQEVDLDSVGLILDNFHIQALRLPLDGIRDIPAAKIFDVQLSDAPMLDIDLVSWSRRFRLLPGRGAFDLAGFVAAIRATGYDGVWSLETFDEKSADLPTKQVVTDAYASLRDLMAD